MNLMICDDQKSELENMGQIVSEYALTHSELSLTVKCFLNPFDMLDEMGKSGVPDNCTVGYLYARYFGY